MLCTIYRFLTAFKLWLCIHGGCTEGKGPLRPFWARPVLRKPAIAAHVLSLSSIVQCFLLLFLPHTDLCQGSVSLCANAMAWMRRSGSISLLRLTWLGCISSGARWGSAVLSILRFSRGGVLLAVSGMGRFSEGSGCCCCMGCILPGTAAWEILDQDIGTIYAHSLCKC